MSPFKGVEVEDSRHDLIRDSLTRSGEKGEAV